MASGIGVKAQTALVVEADFPKPDKDAGSRAVVDLVEGLRSLGIDTRVAAETYPDDLTHHLSQPHDLVVFSRPSAFVRNFQRIDTNETKVIYLAHDLHFVRLSLGQQMGEPESDLAIAIMKRIEGHCFSSADLSLLPTEEEAVLARREFPGIRAQRINYFSMPIVESRLAEVESRGMVFVGSKNHAPNRDGIAWFIDEIFPRVLSVLPDATLTVVGDWGPDFDSAPNTRVLRNVPDTELADIFSRARIGISPLRFGAGMKRKTLHYLSCGVPVVSTKYGLQGIPASLGPNPSAREAETVSQWVSAIVSLYSDPKLWSDFSANAVAFVSEYFDDNAYRRDLQAAVATALG